MTRAAIALLLLAGCGPENVEYHRWTYRDADHGVMCFQDGRAVGLVVGPSPFNGVDSVWTIRTEPLFDYEYFEDLKSAEMRVRYLTFKGERICLYESSYRC